MDEGIIHSRSNPLVRRLRALKEKAGGELMLLEGPKLIEEALASGVGVVEVAASPRVAAGGRAGLVDALRSRGVAVRLVDEGVLASLSEVETSQGILALAPGRPLTRRACTRGLRSSWWRRGSRTPATSGPCCGRRRPRGPPGPTSPTAPPIPSHGRPSGARWEVRSACPTGGGSPPPTPSLGSRRTGSKSSPP